jgi:hypothetical protein
MAVVFTRDKCKCRTGPLLVLQVVDDGCGVSSAYPLELAALTAAAIASTDIQQPLTAMVTDCLSALQVANKMKQRPHRQTSEYHAITLKLTALYDAERKSHRTHIPEATHVRAHPEKRTTRSQDWTDEEMLNHIADFFAGPSGLKFGDRSPEMDPAQDIQLIRVPLSDFLITLRTPGGIYLTRKGGSPMLQGLTEMLEDKRHEIYCNGRDDSRQNADTPRDVFWGLTSTQLAVLVTQLMKASLPEAALRIRSIWDKHRHNGQNRKQEAVTADVALERACPLCQGPDSQKHYNRLCTHADMQALRERLIGEITSKANLRNPIRRDIAMATLNTALHLDIPKVSEEDPDTPENSTPDAYRMWYGLITPPDFRHVEIKTTPRGHASEL